MASTLLGLAIGLTACAGATPKVVATRLPSGSPASECNVLYAGFWPAFQQADLSYLEAQEALDDEQKALVRAARAIEQGRFEDAERVFAELAGTSHDGVLRDCAAVGRFWALFHLERWSEIVDLPPDGFRDVRALAQFYALAPRARVVFGTDPAVVPILMYGDRLPLVEVRVADRRYHFVLDTGATVTVISPEVAKAAALPLGDATDHVKTVTRHTVTARPGVLRRMTVGNAVFENHPCAVIAQDDLRRAGSSQHIDGIVGWNAIRKLDVEIDLRARRAVLRKPQPRVVRERNLLWLGVPVVRCRLDNGFPVLADLDTGSDGSCLFDLFFRAVPEEVRTEAIGSTREEERQTWGIGGSERSRITIAERMAVLLGEQRIEFRDVSIRAFPDAGIFVEVLRLGADVARSGRIRIDFLNGAFEFNT